ncbi:restriction endonuclease [Myxococcus xanthus]|uniref:restriction endonuclease n=1 Tax=Myxococcus xanthus TaxID=34 RepID=UPI0013763D76|nr:restriction endonuclease [Myxococcus xanthus]
MNWERYEQVIVEKFRRDYPGPHFRVEPSGDQKHKIMGYKSGKPRQVDVAVFRRGMCEPFLVVDAKCWKSALDVKDIESFIGLVSDVGAEAGVLVASSGFSKASLRRVEELGITLQVVGTDEALEWDWLGVGRRIYSSDWAFHRELGRALRLLEDGAHAEVVAEVLENVGFDEWENAAGYAIDRHRDEALIFLEWVATRHDDAGWRFNAARRLAEKGCLSDVIRSRAVALEVDSAARKELEEM